MKNYFLIIILAISLIGCKAKKVVTSETSETNTAVTLSHAESTAHQEESVSVEEIFSTATLAEDIELTQTRTVYSSPDSAGKQYPVEQTETRLTSNRQLTAGNQRRNADNQQLKTIKLGEAKADIQQQTATQQKAKEAPRGQAWKTWAAIIVCIGLVALAYLTLKRFRVL